MAKYHRFPSPPSVDDLAAAPLAVKDALRGLRNKLSHIAPNLSEMGISPQDPLSLSPLALATRLLTETRKVASIGEDIARDVLLRHRDENRLAAFAGSGFGHSIERLPEQHRHSFVSSRYAALKILANQFGLADGLILEQPIDTAYRALLLHFSAQNEVDEASSQVFFSRIASSVLLLEKSGALTLQQKNNEIPSPPHLVFASLGLAESILALSTNPSVEATLAALNLAADVINLRKPTIGAIFKGFDPEAQLSAEYRLLAPPLTEA